MDFRSNFVLVIFACYTFNTSFRRAACATETKVPPVAYLANPDGGDVVASSTTEQSTKQAAWLGRIQYYGGRQMWRKAEDKFQQVLSATHPLYSVATLW